ncbi:hypothetical protein C7C45_18255 [Micromonospora arborensis]|uniref:Uncharacterized protein n=1 Tax=Micromonospora arborensis TaxID=2116518 RepID=A0A318NHX3_9ACTN|nr:hypothetical protein C7C45_18255 [Micromonospora arborensis]
MRSRCAGGHLRHGFVDDIPGVEFRGGLCWAELGPTRDAFPATSSPKAEAPGGQPSSERYDAQV